MRPCNELVEIDLIRSKVEINKLRTFKWHKHKAQYLNKGFSIFGIPVKETLLFRFLEDYQTNPNLKIEETDLCKLVDFALLLHRRTSSEPYMHNKTTRINSGKERCLQLLELYKEIKSTGRIEPINVATNHDGTYTITDGSARANIALALGFKTIPVKIFFVDLQLADIMQILKHHYTKGQKVLYTPIEHPAFDDWKVLRDGRWSLIEKEFDWRGKNVLDIGSYTGYFSHKAAKSGANVTAIEPNRKLLEIATRINKLIGLDVNFIHTDLFRYLNGKRFDCILFFSVLHWILRSRGRTGLARTLALVSSSSPLMFFDMGQENEPKMRSKEWNQGLTINKDTIPELVISNSEYTYFRHLGASDGGRDVFKFGRGNV